MRLKSQEILRWVEASAFGGDKIFWLVVVALFSGRYAQNFRPNSCTTRYKSMSSANGGTYARQYPCDGWVDNLEPTLLLIIWAMVKGGYTPCFSGQTGVSAKRSRGRGPHVPQTAPKFSYDALAKGARRPCRAKHLFLFFFEHVVGANGTAAHEGS